MLGSYSKKRVCRNSLFSHVSFLFFNGMWINLIAGLLWISQRDAMQPKVCSFAFYMYSLNFWCYKRQMIEMVHEWVRLQEERWCPTWDRSRRPVFTATFLRSLSRKLQQCPGLCLQKPVVILAHASSPPVTDLDHQWRSCILTRRRSERTENVDRF